MPGPSLRLHGMAGNLLLSMLMRRLEKPTAVPAVRTYDREDRLIRIMQLHILMAIHERVVERLMAIIVQRRDNFIRRAGREVRHLDA